MKKEYKKRKCASHQTVLYNIQN